MELLLYCAVFLGWLCIMRVPSGAVRVATRSRPRSSAFTQPGPGVQLASPWPWDRDLVLERESARHTFGDRFALDAFREVDAANERATWLLRFVVGTYLATIFVGVPLATAQLGAEAAWWRALPLLGVLHLLGLVGLGLARRRAGPLGLELALGAALFPPSMWRAPADLRARRLAGFHPATAAAAWLDEAAWRRAVRIELGVLSDTGDAAIREVLLDLCDQRDTDRDAVLDPERADRLAKSYCPRCLDDFLVVKGRCPGCASDSVPYSEMDRTRPRD